MAFFANFAKSMASHRFTHDVLAKHVAQISRAFLRQKKWAEAEPTDPVLYNEGSAHSGRG
jgi:hypothetical protein